MARGEDEFHRARAVARRLLHEAGVTRPAHIDVDAVARAQGADIVRGPLIGATARVMRLGTKARIRVSDRIAHPGAERFSVAHELGHLVLGHELPAVADVADPVAYVARVCARVRRGGVDPESEADVFAAEFLMPDFLARGSCEVSPVSLEPVRAIAREFKTSICASAIRFAELTSERCAVVYSKKEKVMWAVASPTFTAQIARGVPLDRASVAFDYFHKGTLDDSAQAVPADAWIECGGGGAEIIEHSAVLDDLGAVITVLWVPEAVAPQLGMFD